MSFILDALKKSENERQRQSGPALFEVKVATPRPGLPLWAVALAVLLVVNIGVVIWLVLRKPAQVAQPVPVAQAAIPAPALAPTQAAPTPAPAATSQQPQAIEPAAPVASAPGQSVPPLPSDDDTEPLNPEDYEPATEPGASVPATHAGKVTRSTLEGFPTYEQIAAGGSMPELRLDMHVYAAKPQDRFVFLNMQRLREGESLPNGVHVEQITPDGVVLSHHGAKFVLERE